MNRMMNITISVFFSDVCFVISVAGIRGCVMHRRNHITKRGHYDNE